MSNRRESCQPMVLVENDGAGEGQENTEEGCGLLGYVVGVLAVLSIICGGTIICFGALTIWAGTRKQLQINIRLDPVILKADSPDFDGGLSNALPIWFAAAGTGMVAGLLQISTSLWFLVGAFFEEKLNYPARIWILAQLIAGFVLLIIIGAVFIAGFEADVMLMGFGIDFILINIFVLISVPVFRRYEKELSPADVQGKKMSLFTPLLLI